MILIALSALLCVVGFASADQARLKASKDLIIKEYSSKLDLTGQVPQETIAIRGVNVSPSPLESLTLLLPAERTLVSSIVEDSFGQQLGFKETGQTVEVELEGGKSTSSFKVYQITFEKPVPSDIEFKIASISLHFRSFYDFHPKKINLFEDQKVRVVLLKVPASPYPIEKSAFEAVLGTDRKQEKSSAADVAPLSPVEQRVKFALNTHFVQSSRTKRYVEISHWGNIYVSDEYYLHNRGAKFRGAFSTIDFNKGRKDTGRTAWRKQDIRLPYNAWGLFYRDEIGNISTSTVSRSVASTHPEQLHQRQPQTPLRAARRLELHLVPRLQRADRRHPQARPRRLGLPVRVPPRAPAHRHPIGQLRGQGRAA